MDVNDIRFAFTNYIRKGGSKPSQSVGDGKKVCKKVCGLLLGKHIGQLLL